MASARSNTMTSKRPRTLVQHLCSVPPFAHHPPCSCFHNHLIRVRGVAFCLGCVCLTGGLVLGSTVLRLVAYINSQLLLSLGCLRFVIIGTACCMPTLIQLRVQQKFFKIFARTLLGVGIVLLGCRDFSGQSYCLFL